jgi:hypothetical protein
MADRSRQNQSQTAQKINGKIERLEEIRMRSRIKWQMEPPFSFETFRRPLSPFQNTMMDGCCCRSPTNSMQRWRTGAQTQLRCQTIGLPGPIAFGQNTLRFGKWVCRTWYIEKEWEDSATQNCFKHYIVDYIVWQVWLQTPRCAQRPISAAVLEFSP